MSDPYTLVWMAMVAWVVFAVLIAWFIKRRFWVFILAVATAAPAIAFSMYVHELLPMGGIIHALAAGGFALGMRELFSAFRSPRSSKHDSHDA